jgi:hypothetical protein
MKKYLLLTLLFPSFLFSQSYDALFIGNSYTFYNNMPTLVSEIALSLGDTLNVESNTPGGTNFQTHAAANSSSMQAIRQKPWDFVILQAQSQEPSFSPEQVQVQTYPFAANLVDSILENDSCTEPMFFMTWGRKNGDAINGQGYPEIATYLGMQQRLRESYLEMGFDNDASVSPVGMAWKRSIAENPDFELYNADESHPNLAGSYLTACVFYASIFGESCVGSTYYPNGITEEEAANLQQIASETVLDSTAVWNLFAIQDVSLEQFNLSFTFNFEATNYDNLVWDFGDGTTSNLANVTHDFAFDSEYTITLYVYNAQGCLIGNKLFNISTLNLSDVDEYHNSITIRPNPTSDFLQIESNDSFKAKIYNVLGELMIEMDNESIVDMTSFPNGNYVLQIHTVSEMKHFNIIKK